MQPTAGSRGHERIIRAVRLRGLDETLPPALATAVGISAAAHCALYVLTPVLSLHVVALGGTSAQVGLLFAVFSLVAVLLRPAAGAWIDRQGARRALLPGAAIMALASLGLQAAAGPAVLTALMAAIGVGYGLVTMAAAMLAASAPAERRARALSIYYMAPPVAMAVATPLALALFRGPGIGANFALVTALGLVALAFGLSPRSSAGPRAPAPGATPLWSRGAVPLSAVLTVAAMGQSALYAFLPLHAAAHGQEGHLGWFFGVYSGGMIVFRIAVSGLADRLGRTQLLLPALGCLAVGFGVLIPPPAAAHLAAAAVLLAAGSAALYPMLVALVVDRVPERERGVAMGTVSGAWDLGVFAGSLLIGAVVEQASHGAGFVTAAALILTALGALVLVERRRLARPAR